MSDHTRRVKTQWNSYVRPFDSFSNDEISGLLGYCSETCKVAEQFSGKQCFLAYGALLGFERSGKLIPHDFDIDVAINCGESTRNEVAETCRKLMVSFLDAGYEVKAKCFAQFFVLPPKESKQRYKVEFFASWIEEEKFYLYFALPGIDIVDSLFPLKEVVLEGHSFYAPKDASALLSATYGDDWRVPNSEFKYDMSGGKWIPFRSYFFSRNKKQWDDHYTENALDQNVEMSQDNELVCSFALSNDKTLSILDFGCGAGEVAVGFASCGHHVTALDTSDIAIEQLSAYGEKYNLPTLSAKVINLYDIPACDEFAKEQAGCFDLIVANKLLDHLSLVGESTFFKTASQVLSDNGAIHVFIPTEALVSAEVDTGEMEPNKRTGVVFYTRTLFLENLKQTAAEYNLLLETDSEDDSGASTRLIFKLDVEKARRSDTSEAYAA